MRKTIKKFEFYFGPKDETVKTFLISEKEK